MNKSLIYLILAAAAWLVIALRNEEVNADPAAKLVPAGVSSSTESHADRAPPTSWTSSSPADTQPSELIGHKYDALLDHLSPSLQERVKQALIARESSNPLNMHDLATHEREISTLLSEDDYAFYELLRESEGERAQVEQFAQQVSPTAPLSQQQERELLAAKLKHKHQVQTLELQANDRSDLSLMERGYVRDIATQGLEHYTQAFLDEARTMLTNDQWLALEQFETASIAARLREAEPHAPAAL